MGTPIEVKAKAKNGSEGSVMYDFGDDIEESVGKFTGPACHGAVLAHGKVQLQAVMRRHLEAGQDVATLADTWKLGVTSPRAAVDYFTAAKTLYATKSPEEKAEFLEMLKSMG